LMKLIFAVLDVLLTMGLTRCYKTEGFYTFINYNDKYKNRHCTLTRQIRYHRRMEVKAS